MGSNYVSRQAEDLGRRAAKAGSEAESAAQETVERGRQVAGRAAQMAQDVVGEVGDRASMLYRRGVSQARWLGNSLEVKVERNPIAALVITACIALASGMLLGGVFRRH